MDPQKKPLLGYFLQMDWERLESKPPFSSLSPSLCCNLTPLACPVTPKHCTWPPLFAVHSLAHSRRLCGCGEMSTAAFHTQSHSHVKDFCSQTSLWTKKKNNKAFCQAARDSDSKANQGQVAVCPQISPPLYTNPSMPHPWWKTMLMLMRGKRRRVDPAAHLGCWWESWLLWNAKLSYRGHWAASAWGWGNTRWRSLWVSAYSWRRGQCHTRVSSDWMVTQQRSCEVSLEQDWDSLKKSPFPTSCRSDISGSFL